MNNMVIVVTIAVTTAFVIIVLITSKNSVSLKTKFHLTFTKWISVNIETESKKSDEEASK